MRTALAAPIIVLSTSMLAVPAGAWAGDAKGASASAPQTRILLSFKVDPRVLGPTYGGERWVSPPTYTGARAQGSVETSARVVDARGAPVETDLEWTVSDPEVLDVSPPSGARVTIAAKRAGTSTVTVKAGKASKTLTVKADQPAGVWQMSVRQ
jgi:hypothetical protein